MWSKENWHFMWVLDPWKGHPYTPQQPLSEGLASTLMSYPLSRWAGNLMHMHTLQKLADIYSRLLGVGKSIPKSYAGFDGLS